MLNTPYGQAEKTVIGEYTDPVVSKTLDLEGNAYVETTVTTTYLIKQTEADAKQAKLEAYDAAKEKAIIDAEAAEKAAIAAKLNSLK